MMAPWAGLLIAAGLWERQEIMRTSGLLGNLGSNGGAAMVALLAKFVHTC